MIVMGRVFGGGKGFRFGGSVAMAGAEMLRSVCVSWTVWFEESVVAMRERIAARA